MTDTTLDALLEAVRFLVLITPLDRVQYEDRPTLEAIEEKLDALIKLRGGRPDDQPAK